MEEIKSNISRATIVTLKEVFPQQLGFADEPAIYEKAKEVVGQFAPGWVWVNVEPFKVAIAGEEVTSTQQIAVMVEIRLLENALDEPYQDKIVSALADAIRNTLEDKAERLDLSVFNSTGNVQMSVPGASDSLLTSEGVHTFLTQEIVKVVRPKLESV
jgi:hypothetical protein